MPCTPTCPSWGNPITLPRICPIPGCGHVFTGNGWDGIDPHYKHRHEAQTGIPYRVGGHKCAMTISPNGHERPWEGRRSGYTPTRLTPAKPVGHPRWAARPASSLSELSCRPRRPTPPSEALDHPSGWSWNAPDPGIPMSEERPVRCDSCFNKDMGSGSVRCPKTARWRMMGYCGRSSPKTSNSSA